MTHPTEGMTAVERLNARLSELRLEPVVPRPQAQSPVLEPLDQAPPVDTATTDVEAPSDGEAHPDQEPHELTDAHGPGLMEAIKRDELAAVERLLQDHCNPNFRDKQGNTPLHRCATFNRPDLVRLLVRYHADVNAVEPVRGATPLHLAVAYGHLEVTQALLEHEANATAVDKQGNTPMHTAHEVPGDQLGAILLLLKSHGAKHAVMNEQGKKPGQNLFKVKPPLRPAIPASKRA